MASTSRFFETLNYSAVNEDWRTEASALRIEAGDVVLCVTGSGDRPLDLLALDPPPARVLAVDLGPAQSHLLALKVAALCRLDYDAYAAFLGLRSAPAPDRLRTLRALATDLTAEARRYWEEHARSVAEGVLYAGRFERFYGQVSRLARLLRPRAVRTLFELGDLEAQRAFVREVWDAPWWRRAFELCCHPALLRFAFGDPGFYQHADVALGPYAWKRIRAGLQTHLARESFMMGLLFLGRLPPGDLPPYLTRDGVQTILARLDRLDVATADVIALMRDGPPGRFTRFSLSDVPSYLSVADFERLLDAVLHAAAPGARVCIRQFLTRRRLPDRLAVRLAREPELEARLAREDRSIVYDFIVAQVRSG
jgi:S-adenosylmethionine-diacylglycerol 3-amino-3-carboxypropyl transferase